MWVVVQVDKVVSHLAAFSRSNSRFFGVLLKGTLLLCEGDTNRCGLSFFVEIWFQMLILERIRSLVLLSLPLADARLKMEKQPTDS